MRIAAALTGLFHRSGSSSGSRVSARGSVPLPNDSGAEALPSRQSPVAPSAEGALRVPLLASRTCQSPEKSPASSPPAVAAEKAGLLRADPYQVSRNAAPVVSVMPDGEAALLMQVPSVKDQKEAPTLREPVPQPPVEPPGAATWTPTHSTRGPLRQRLAQGVRHRVRAVAEGVIGIGYGPALGIKRNVVEPVVDKVKPVIDRVQGHKPQARPEGAQFQFEKQGWYGVQSEFPDLVGGLAHNYEVLSALNPRKSAANEAIDKLERAQTCNPQLPRHQREQVERHREHQQDEAFSLKRLRLNPLACVRIKKGRITVKPQLTGLSTTERKLSRQRAREARTLLNTPGNPAVHIEPHGPSDGELVTYQDGEMRWVKSPGAHLPLATFGTVRTPDGTSVVPASPPPLELQTGVVQTKGHVWRQHEGLLYRFDGSRWQAEGKPVKSLQREIDGRVWARTAQGAVCEVRGDEVGPALLRGLEHARSVRVLPLSGLPSEMAMGALVLGHDGRVSLHSQDTGSKRIHREALFQADPGLTDVVMASPDRVFGYDKESGTLRAYSRVRHAGASAWKCEPVDLCARMPLDAGQSWKVVSMGFEPGPHGQEVALQVVATTSQGHRVSFVNDAANGVWLPQWNAEGGILRNDCGLAGVPQNPRGATLKLDATHELSVANAESELCLRQGSGEWTRLRGPAGEPLKDIDKVVTDPSGMPDGKKLFALQRAPGERGRIVEIALGGRVKRLPADNATHGWSAGTPPLPTPEKLTAVPGHVLVTEPALKANRIVDFAVNQQGHVWHVTQAGHVFFTPSTAPPEGSWPREFASPRQHDRPFRMPAPFVRLRQPDGSVRDTPCAVKQIVVLADTGRVWALAQPGGAPAEAPLHLMEFKDPQRLTQSPDSGTLPGWRPIQLESKVGALKAGAKLGVNLYGTPVIEISEEGQGSEAPPERYRVLPLGPGRAMLHNVKLCNEDAIKSLDRVQGARLPGSAYMNETGKTVLGHSWVNEPIAAALKEAYRDDGVKGVAKHVASGTLHSAMRPLELAPGTVASGLKRVGQDVFAGRSDLKADYDEVHAALKSTRTLVEPVFSASEEALLMAGVARDGSAYRPPAHLAIAEVQGVASDIAEKALDRAITSLEHIAITADLLDPDLKTQHPPGRMRHARGKVTQLMNQTGDSRDVLPDVVACCDRLKALRETDGLTGLFSEQECAQLDKLFKRVALLQEHKVALWDDKRGKGFNFAAYHGSFPIQTAALARSLHCFNEALRLRSVGNLKSFKINTVATGDPDSKPLADRVRMQAHTLHALQTLRRNFRTDVPIELASFGFSGWAAYEGFAEAVKDLRTQAFDAATFLKPGSLTYDNLIKTLGIENPGSLSEEELRAVMANKFSETVLSFDQRATLFNLISKEAGVGIFPSNSLLGQVVRLLTSGVSGAVTLGRSTGFGVEPLADGSDGTKPGSVIAYFTRTQFARVAAQFQANVADPHVFRMALGYGRMAASVEGAAMRGGAAVINREDFPAFMMDLLNPAVPAKEVLRRNGERSSRQGAIALNLAEVSAAASVAVGSGFNADQPTQPWRADPMTFGASQTLMALQVQAAVSKRVMNMRLRLGISGKTGVGNERGGGYGSRADFLLAARAGLDVVKFDTDHEQNLRLAGLGIDVVGLRASVNNITEYKRTSDWVAAQPVSKSDWDDLAARAREIPGLSVPALDPSRDPLERAKMLATLQQWVQRLEAMEVAVLSDRENRPKLWSHYQATQPMAAHLDAAQLRIEAAGVDEVKVVGFMHRAREASIRDRLAARGQTMLQSSARIELNVPTTHVLNRKGQRNWGHQKLGSVMAKTEAAREQIPGMKMAMKAFAQLPGYNQTRGVFDLNRRLVADLNEMLLADDLGAGQPLTYHDVEAVLAHTPVIYQPVALVAKNKEIDRQSVALPVGLAFRQSSEMAKDRTMAELRYVYGFGDRLVAADFLPSGQQALSQATHGLRAFAAQGEHLVPPPN